MECFTSQWFSGWYFYHYIICWFLEFWEYFKILQTFPNWGSFSLLVPLHVCFALFSFCAVVIFKILFTLPDIFFRGSWLLNYRWIFKSLCFLCQNRSGLRWANIREALFTWNFQRCPRGSQLEILKKEGYDIYGECCGGSPSGSL